MSGEAVLFVYLGAVGAICLLNAVQWSFFRDWVYGLFTLQTCCWFIHSIFNRVVGDDTPLTESQNMALHSATNGVVALLYLELVRRLVDLPHHRPQAARWMRWGQLGFGFVAIMEVTLLLTDEGWQRTPFGRTVSIFYWLLIDGVYIVGASLAIVRRDAVGWLLAVGSLLTLVNTTNTLFYYTGFPWTLSRSPASVNLHVQILGATRILQLVCFSLALAFRQRQIAVNQAIDQTRQTEKLTQQRLETELTVRRLEQEKTEVQLRALQAQVNPHFLFNSLNSLSSLIDDDPDRASQFVDRLSHVYRYLLKANDQPLSTLANELDFIQSYYHLLKTRYGNGLTLTNRINPAYESRLLPPLTLQLLVENAVKHNITLARQPLCITIATDETGYLVVSNNLQRKRTSVLSNGVGLLAIRTQYRSFNQAEPEISEAESSFTVRLPLIEPVGKQT